MADLRWMAKDNIEDRLKPGYGDCGRCGLNWGYAKGHDTNYCPHDDPRFRIPELGIDAPDPSPCQGMFPLCEPCWVELETPANRLPYYRGLWQRWVDDTGGDPAYEYNGVPLARIWTAIEQAVLAGL